MESHEVVRALTEHAKSLGWESEWDWKDTADDDGTVRYEVWIWPARSEADDAE